MNKTMLIALLAITMLAFSAIAVSALNIDLMGNSKNKIKLDERSGSNSGSDDDSMTDNSGEGSGTLRLIDISTAMHFDDLTEEQKTRLRAIAQAQAEAIVKSNLSAQELSNVADLSQERLKIVAEIRAHILKAISERKDLLEKLSKLRHDQARELNHFTRAEAKKLLEEQEEDELDELDLVEKRKEKEHFAEVHLRKRTIANIDAIKRLAATAEAEIEVSAEAQAEAKGRFRIARLEWNACKEEGDANSTDCIEKRNKFKERTIEWLEKTVDNLLKKLERLKLKVDESERLSQEEATKTIQEIDALIVILTKAKADIGLLSADSSGEQIAAQAKIVSNAWIKVHLLDKRISGELIGRHAGEIIVRAEHLEDKLNDLLERFNESDQNIEGLDELVDEFSEHILSARTHYNTAKGYWEQIDGILGDTNNTDSNVTVPELVKKAHAELRLAHQELKEAHNVLKQIFKLLKDNRHELRENEEPFFRPGKELGYLAGRKQQCLDLLEF